jgi:glyoxylase-like metal-dependent hydrolase (beta-lactamase superfamily II)
MEKELQMEKWFEGVYLLGQFNSLRTGCWLLAHAGEAAILELPPGDLDEPSPAETADAAVRSLNLSVKFLLCTHDHGDHFSEATLDEFQVKYPQAAICLQRGFKNSLEDPQGVHWFDDLQEISLSGEPLFLVHAPKHSMTDTMVIFRGTICTGDWELDTIRSVHDGWSGITVAQKLASINRLVEFVSAHNYHIHQVFSVHANDKRHQVSFIELMESTRVDRVFW